CGSLPRNTLVMNSFLPMVAIGIRHPTYPSGASAKNTTLPWLTVLVEPRNPILRPVSTEHLAGRIESRAETAILPNYHDERMFEVRDITELGVDGPGAKCLSSQTDYSVCVGLRACGNLMALCLKRVPSVTS